MATTYHYNGVNSLWEDVVMPPTAVNPSGPDTAMTVDLADIFGALVASTVGTPTCVALFQIPHAYKPGTALSFHIHWVKNDGSDNAGTVPWLAKWRISPINAVMGAYTEFASGTEVVATGDVRYHHGITSWEIPATSIGISTIIAVMVRRNGGTSGDAAIIGMDIHYRRGQQGSYAETSLA